MSKVALVKCTETCTNVNTLSGIFVLYYFPSINSTKDTYICTNQCRRREILTKLSLVFFLVQYFFNDLQNVFSLCSDLGQFSSARCRYAGISAP